MLYLSFPVKLKRFSLKFYYLRYNSKPITVETIYRSPSKSNFLEVINDNMSKIDSVNNETYILVDFNINLYLNDSYILAKKIS